MKKLALFTLFLASGLLCSAAQAGESKKFTMKNGETIEGEIVYDKANFYSIRGKYNLFTIDKNDVESISSSSDTPQATLSTKGIAPWYEIYTSVRKRFPQTNIEQIPPTYIGVGVMRNVPYQSFRTDQLEFNIYGDPLSPAGVEVGVIKEATKSDELKQKCLEIMNEITKSTLPQGLPPDLNLTQDKKTNRNLVIEVTPPEAEDAYGGWWISLYDEKKLDDSRANESELAAITEKRPEKSKSVESSTYSWSKDDYKKARTTTTTTTKLDAGTSYSYSSSNTVYVRGYYRKNGTYVRPHTRSSGRRK